MTASDAQVYRLSIRGDQGGSISPRRKGLPRGLALLPHGRDAAKAA